MDYMNIGRYRGMNIYGLTLDEYLNLEERERSERSHWWYISDNKHLLLGEEVVGLLENRMVELYDKRTNYKVVYNKQIKAKKVVKVVSERPTVEALAAEGEKKLEEASKTAETNLAENLGTGEEKLAEVVNQGVQLTTTIQKRARKQRVKREV